MYFTVYIPPGLKDNFFFKYTYFNKINYGFVYQSMRKRYTQTFSTTLQQQQQKRKTNFRLENFSSATSNRNDVLKLFLKKD